MIAGQSRLQGQNLRQADDTTNSMPQTELSKNTIYHRTGTRLRTETQTFLLSLQCWPVLLWKAHCEHQRGTQGWWDQKALTKTWRGTQSQTAPGSSSRLVQGYNNNTVLFFFSYIEVRSIWFENSTSLFKMIDLWFVYPKIKWSIILQTLWSDSMQSTFCFNKEKSCF